MGLFDQISGAVQNVVKSPSSVVMGPMGQVMNGVNGFNGNTGSPQASVAPFTPPPVPDYQSSQNADGTLKAPYSVQAGQLGDTSAWQALAQQQNKTNTDQAVSNAQTQGQTGAQTAWAGLAQNGGLDSGARERVAQQGSKAAMMAGQGARQQGDNNSLNIGLQGQQMDRAGQQFNIGNNLQANQFNAAQASQNLAGQNSANQFNYGQQMANQTGMYTANAGMSAQNNRPKSIWESMLGGIV